MARVLITRAPHQASVLADALRELGHEPVLVPAIELAPPTSFAGLDAAIADLTGQGSEGFHWLVFTSANAVEAFAARLQTLGAPYLDSEMWDGSIAAIGPATARAVSKLLGREPSLTPSQAVAESLAEALLPYSVQPDGSPTRFLLVRAEQGREHLPEVLRAAGTQVVIASAYRTVVPQESLPKIRSLFEGASSYPDAIAFTSSSTATNLAALLEAGGVALPSSVLRVSIGPVTSQTLRELGLPPHAEAVEATVPSLVEALLQVLALWR